MKRDTHPELMASIRELWKEPPVHLMTEQARNEYSRRKAALDAYLDGTRVRTVTESTGLTRSALVRMADRAVRLDSTGLPLGYHACVKNMRSVRPARRSPMDPKHIWRNRGLACAMRQVANLSDEVESFIDDAIDRDRWRNRKARKSLFMKFKRLVLEADASVTYPFDSKDGGWAAFFRYLRRESEKRGPAVTDPAPHARVHPSPGDNSGRPSASRSRRIYDEVEFDGFLQPIDMEILLPSDFQMDAPLRIEGLGLLAAIERKSTALIGYLPLLKTSYDGLDVLGCFTAALSEWKPRTLGIPVFDYLPGAALPSGADPAANGHLWNLLFWDNHRAQISPMVRDSLISHIYCDINLGRAGEPTARPLVERFFGNVTQLNLRGLLERRQLRPITADQQRIVAGAIPLQWVLDLLDITCANYNVTPKKTLDQRKPLDILISELRREDGWNRQDASENADWRRLNYINVRLPIHRLKGRSPYVYFESAQYTSEALRDYASDRNSGNEIDVEINLKDLRDIRATSQEGIDLHILHARPPWQSPVPCDIQTRRLIARSRRRDGIPMRDINDDAQARFTRKHLAMASESRSSGSTIATMALRGSLGSVEEPKHTRQAVPRGGWIDIDEI